MVFACACSKSESARLASPPPLRSWASPAQTAATRRTRRRTSPLASERPGGPVPPLGAAGFGFGLLFTPTAPCAPPRSIGRADRARGTECLHPMPVPGSAHTSPSTPTARTCERACCCCLPWSIDHRPAATNPPPLPAAYIRAARRASPQATGWAGGKNFQCGLTRATVSAELPVVSLEWM